MSGKTSSKQISGGKSLKYQRGKQTFTTQELQSMIKEVLEPKQKFSRPVPSDSNPVASSHRGFGKESFPPRKLAASNRESARGSGKGFFPFKKLAEKNVNLTQESEDEFSPFRKRTGKGFSAQGEGRKVLFSTPTEVVSIAFFYAYKKEKIKKHVFSMLLYFIVR